MKNTKIKYRKCEMKSESYNYCMESGLAVDKVHNVH